MDISPVVELSFIKMSFTQKQTIGNLGEDMACKFLMKQGYKIIERNYRKKWGEIDIIATKNNILHFVEVKTTTVSSETNYKPKTDLKDKSVRPTSYSHNWFRPEDNIHHWKRKRLARASQTYLLENPACSGTEDTEWQTDSLAVFLDFKTRKAKFRLLENIIL